MKLKFIDSKSLYTSGKSAYSGKIKVGGYSWNGVDGRTPGKRYVIYAELPSMFEGGGRAYKDTPEECEQLLQEKFDLWMKKLGVE